MALLYVLNQFILEFLPLRAHEHLEGFADPCSTWLWAIRALLYPFGLAGANDTASFQAYKGTNLAFFLPSVFVPYAEGGHVMCTYVVNAFLAICMLIGSHAFRAPVPAPAFPESLTVWALTVPYIACCSSTNSFLARSSLILVLTLSLFNLGYPVLNQSALLVRDSTLLFLFHFLLGKG